MTRRSISGEIAQSVTLITLFPTDMRKFFKYTGYSVFQYLEWLFCPKNTLTNDWVSHKTQNDFKNVSNNKLNKAQVVLSVNLQHFTLPILRRECFSLKYYM